MKKSLLVACMLLGLATTPVAAATTTDSGYALETVSTETTYVGTLNTVMGSKTSTTSNFSLEYENGTLVIPSFQVGSMPGTIEVYATGLTLGTEKKCANSVTLTIGSIVTTYSANVCVSYNASNKLTVSIDVLNPIYEGLSFVAEVDFVEN